ncbi:hypothetical protein V9L05_01445 [Bernardetia sp. Wsw4-3y2]|uniref:hypothetical protein n=1 Tax=Bernardetia sp. Wsw4-3y2 TaxID=3127471 RepID=UPI0030D02BA7
MNNPKPQTQIPVVQKIELKESFLNNWIDSISNHVGTNSVLLGFIIRLILFFVVASLIIKIFWKGYPWLAGGIVALIFFADVGFTLSALMAAKFYNSKVMLYARIFFGISLFGLLFICWKLYDFTDSFYPSDSNPETEYLKYSLNAIFFTSAILAFLFTEGGAYMIFSLTSKEDRNSETTEIRNSETGEKQAENDVSDEDEEKTQGKIEELPLPKCIKKTGEDKYSINNELPKTLEGFRGNARTHKSKKIKFIEAGKYRAARKSEVWENYYNYIVEMIDFQNKDVNGEPWTFFPNGSLADDTQPEQKKRT